ncbi:hypothetical protein DRO69_07150 [Candidatus Bathyarchaeota archaeon]|nr:MAG: hypothetical protein DRO69_07150 [Candidatus Bathyarchaeota archaeon]
MKLKLVLLYGNNIEFKKANYDPDYGVATVKSKRWLRKGIHTRYLVDLKHLFYPPKRKMPHVLIDAHLRKSIKPERIEEKDAKIKLAGNPNPTLKARLDYMNEQTFWGSLILKMKIPMHMVLIFMFTGAGVYSFIRMLLSAFGYTIP